MADDARGNRQGGKRRRYFRRKEGDKPQGEGAPPAQPDAPRTEHSPRATRPGRSDRPAGGHAARSGSETGPLHERHGGHAATPAASGGRTGVRRRRRNKNRRGGEGRSEQPMIPAAREPDYIAPQSVYIYTHIVRSSAQGYEFRAEHFSKVGRTLDDYAIDLSSLFDEEGRIQLSRMNLSVLHGLDMSDDAVPADAAAFTAPATMAAALPHALEQADVGEADESRFDDTRALPTRDIDGAPDLPPVYGAEDTAPPLQEDEPDGPTMAASNE